jgi:hypothetical protein
MQEDLSVIAGTTQLDPPVLFQDTGDGESWSPPKLFAGGATARPALERFWLL